MTGPLLQDCQPWGRAHFDACSVRHGVLNQVFEADLTFFMNGCEVMRRVGVKNGFIIACAHTAGMRLSNRSLT